MKRALVGAMLLVGCQSDPSEKGPVPAPARPVSFTLSAGDLGVTAPARAAGVLRVARSSEAWIEVEALEARDVAGVRGDDGRVSYQDAFAHTRLVHLASAGRTEELRHVTAEAGSLRYAVRLGPGLARLRVVDDHVEALDARGVALLRTEPAFLVDARGTRRSLFPTLAHEGERWLLTYELDDRALVYPLDIDPAWTVTTSLATARRDDTLHVVAGGKVVAIGGIGNGVPALASVESWDPATSSWTAAGSLQRARAVFSAVTLASGKVFVAGGVGLPSAPDTGQTAELYDPSTGTSTLLPTPAPDDLGVYSATVALSASEVLVLYGASTTSVDLTTNVWTKHDFVVARDFAAAKILPSGKVLAAGGTDGTASLSSAELFDQATKTWSAIAPMKVARSHPEMLVLGTGKVLVAGGRSETAELYDPATGTWTSASSMSADHAFGGSVVLPSGRALMFGGDLADGISDGSDLYDPTSNTWQFSGTLASARDEFGFALLPSGKVMLAGGSNGTPVSIVELFEPLAGGKACVGPGECVSGYCVDGFCCDKSGCGAGETCGGPGTPGKCLKNQASGCSADAECASAHCVDGVCCDSACTGDCAACDVKASVGKCTPVAAGDAPHGKRTPCAGEGPCKGRCGGVDRTKCTQFPGSAISCASPTCAAGAEARAAGCNGGGSCAIAAGKKCDPYACGKDACKTACEADADCAPGNSCDLSQRKCVIASTCEGEHAVVSPEGKTKDCTPYRCSAAKCLDTCGDSNACVVGYVCDAGSAKCVPGSAPTASSGGCGVGSPAGPGGLLAALAALAGLGLLGARRRIRRS